MFAKFKADEVRGYGLYAGLEKKTPKDKPAECYLQLDKFGVSIQVRLSDEQYAKLKGMETTAKVIEGETAIYYIATVKAESKAKNVRTKQDRDWTFIEWSYGVPILDELTILDDNFQPVKA